MKNKKPKHFYPYHYYPYYWDHDWYDDYYWYDDDYLYGLQQSAFEKGVEHGLKLSAAQKKWTPPTVGPEPKPGPAPFPPTPAPTPKEGE